MTCVCGVGSRTSIRTCSSTAPIFTQAILNIWNGTSVSSLFDADTLSPIYDGLYAAE